MGLSANMRLIKIKNKYGEEVAKSEDIANAMEDFYNDLYTSQMKIKSSKEI